MRVALRQQTTAKTVGEDGVTATQRTIQITWYRK